MGRCQGVGGLEEAGEGGDQQGEGLDVRMSQREGGQAHDMDDEKEEHEQAGREAQAVH